jgi:hypothetical protein
MRGFGGGGLERMGGVWVAGGYRGEWWSAVLTIAAGASLGVLKPRCPPVGEESVLVDGLVQQVTIACT